jgi:hypothetical protein
MSKDVGYSDSKKDTQGSQIRKLKEQLEIAIKALEQVNQEELSSQRPGEGYSKSARISYEALVKARGKV